MRRLSVSVVATCWLASACGLLLDLDPADQSTSFDGSIDGGSDDAASGSRDGQTRMDGTVVRGDDGGATPPPASATSISAGRWHTCAVMGDGSVRCWGENMLGQLGNGVMAGPTPMALVAEGVGSAIGVGAGEKHTCVARTGTDTLCWGANDSGQLGDGTMVGHVSPMPIAFSEPLVAISGGTLHTCGIDSAAQVLCWGDNRWGQLGDGSIMARPAPHGVDVGAPARSVDAGVNHSCAVRTDGLVMCWGANSLGQVGTRPSMPAILPVEVPGVAGVTMLSAGGDHTCAIYDGGVLTCWGENARGELGNGGPATSAAPGMAITTDGIVVDAMSIAAGRDFTCAARAGTVACWGANDFGQLANGTVGTDSWTAINSADFFEVVEVTAGEAHACARRTDGKVLCWGANDHGQLGDGTLVAAARPVSVIGL